MKENKNTYVGRWGSLYRIVLDTYFNGVTFTHTEDGEYVAEKDSIKVVSQSVVDLERQMFQERMDV